MVENGYTLDYGDAYMEQEEEWEREGLLDPAWEKQQKKVSDALDIIFIEKKNLFGCRINSKFRMGNLSHSLNRMDYSVSISTGMNNQKWKKKNGNNRCKLLN